MQWYGAVLYDPQYPDGPLCLIKQDRDMLSRVKQSLIARGFILIHEFEFVQG